MPRDYSKPPRGDRPKSGERGFEKFAKKPWEKREHAQSDERGERPFRKPFGEKREFGAARRDFRPTHRDDELFKAGGKVADIVGVEPQCRYDILRKLWDFFREENLITPAGHRMRADANDWRHSEHDFHHRDGEDRPRKREYRKPAGDHPTARRARTLEGVPRRKFKETRER